MPPVSGTFSRAAAAQKLGTPGRHCGGITPGLQDLLQVTKGGIDGNITDVQHGNVLPGIQILPHRGGGFFV